MVPIHYLANVHIFIEKMALNHGFAHNLSKFCLKVACCIIKNTPFA